MNNQNLYKLSLIFAEDLLKDNVISQNEFYKMKNEFKRIYKINEDIVPCG